MPVIRLSGPVQIDSGILRNPELNALDKAIYCILCSYEDYPVWGEPTRDTLKRLTQATENQIAKTLKRLESRELITIQAGTEG